MATQAQYDAAKAAITKLVQDEEANVPPMFSGMVGMVPQDMLEDFINKAATQATDAVLAVK